MPERILKEIKEIEGVESVAVVSFKGEPGYRAGYELTEQELKSIGLYLIRVFAAASLHGQKLVSMEILWRDRVVLARFADGFVIITLLKNVKALPLLRITLNVTAANLLSDKTFLKWLKKQKYDPLRHLQQGEFDEEEIRLISNVRSSIL